MCQVIDFSVSTDHKLKLNEKKKYDGLTRKQEKKKHENAGTLGMFPMSSIEKDSKNKKFGEETESSRQQQQQQQQHTHTYTHTHKTSSSGPNRIFSLEKE